MLPKNVTTHATVPGVRVNTSSASSSSLVVNNRNLGSRGELSGGFGSASANAREKMQLRHMMAKNNSELYANNPVAQRRLQQQYASKAGELYGIDPKKLMNAGSQTVTPSLSGSNAGSSSNYGASASRPNPWNTSTTFSVQDKMRTPSPLGR